MREAMLSQEFTLENMDTLSFMYHEEERTLNVTGKDAEGNQFIEIPTNCDTPVTITHITANKRLKDFIYRVRFKDHCHTYASYAHLLTGLPLALDAIRRKGVEVNLKN